MEGLFGTSAMGFESTMGTPLNLTDDQLSFWQRGGFLFGPLALVRHDCQPVGRVVPHGELWAVEISQEVKVGEEITVQWGAVHCPCLCCSGLHRHNPCLMCDPTLANTGDPYVEALPEGEESWPPCT